MTQERAAADEKKRLVGIKAAEYIESGMHVGIGSGTTVYWLIQALGKRIAREGLSFRGVATSRETVRLAKASGINTVSLNDVDHLDLAIDGADEVDPQGRLIKGGGGALVRERLVARAADRFIVIVDPSKFVEVLGRFPLPIEVIPFGWKTTAERIRGLGINPVLRKRNQRTFVSDNGNYILDVEFGTIPDPEALYRSLKLIAGVVDCGIFAEFQPTVLSMKAGSFEERSFG